MNEPHDMKGSADWKGISQAGADAIREVNRAVYVSSRGMAGRAPSASQK